MMQVLVQIHSHHTKSINSRGAGHIILDTCRKSQRRSMDHGLPHLDH